MRRHSAKQQAVGSPPRGADAAALAVNGGPKSITGFRGQAKPKIGGDEFLALADTWGYGVATRRKIRKAIAAEPRSINPHLARYYNPRPSRVKALEEYACRLFGCKYALGVNSGTSALISAYVGCGIGPGDEVIVPGYTFFATAAAAVAAKAIPVIAEVDDSLTLDPADVERKITSRTRAIVPVHMVGNGCDMDRLMEIARRHRLIVIEDNAQACGGKHKGRFLGTIGDMGCFSLSMFKITGAGEAGLVVTNNERYYTRAQNQHDTGACWRPDRFAEERWPGELFCGENYRMSELEGAVNLVQLRKTAAQARRYNGNIRRIVGGLEPFPETRVRRSNDIAGDVGYCLILLAASSRKAEKLAEALRAEGVGAGERGTKSARDWHIYAYWQHILEQKSATAVKCPFGCPYYKGPLPAYSPDMCPRTLDLLSRAVFVGVNQWWTAGDCHAVATAINKVCGVLG
jgi:8-amino-3,8-dideoxy-alpha-D-manno-octulosonate transaminase